jgi:hypothetical protein
MIMGGSTMWIAINKSIINLDQAESVYITNEAEMFPGKWALMIRFKGKDNIRAYPYDNEIDVKRVFDTIKQSIIGIVSIK